MAKYRKKPVVVEAEQFLSKDNLPKGILVETFPTCGEFGSKRFPIYYVVTIHLQKADVRIGDWIIEEPDGEHFYPCKPDIFEETYELVE